MKNLSLFILLIALMFANCNSSSSGGGGTMVLIETNMGAIKLKLYDETPKHKKNFLKLIKEGYYDGLLFHRVIRNFMLQGGDPYSKDAQPGMMLGAGGPDYKIPAEIGRHHFKGALAAARLGNQANPNKESSGSQFYIVQGQPVTRGQIDMMSKGKNVKYTEEDYKKYETVGGTPFLDGDYTVFGEVVEGHQIIDIICNVEVDNNSRPTKDIKMKITVL